MVPRTNLWDAVVEHVVCKCREGALAGVRNAGEHRLADCQVYTDHLARFGAKEIPRSEYLKMLTVALRGLAKYNPKLLECFENNFPGRDYWVRFTCPEFTALNPATGEPYAATILINYIPGGFHVESKSLKLYMFSFRNSSVGGELAEVVLKDLKKLLDPKYVEVEVRAIPRKGIDDRVMKKYVMPEFEIQKVGKGSCDLVYEERNRRALI